MTSTSGRGTGSFFSNLSNWITGSSTELRSDDNRKSYEDSQQQEAVLKINLSNDKEKAKALRTVSPILGVRSVSVDGDERMVVSGTMDIASVVIKLRKKQFLVEVISVERRKKAEPKKESGDKKKEKEDQNMLKMLEVARSGGEKAFLGENQRQLTERSDGSGLVISAVDEYTNITNPDDIWNSFCEFLNNRLRPLSLSGCLVKDAIDFLCMWHWRNWGDFKTLVSRLSAACGAYGIKPKDNPFRSLAVITYLKEVRVLSKKPECILLFSCHETLDPEETSFNEAVLEELCKQEVTPLRCDLSGRGNLDAEMLYRSSIGIMVVSSSYFSRGTESFDHLVEIMERWKAKDLAIIPVFFKVTFSDVCDLGGRFEEVLVQFLDSFKADKIQNESASIDRHQWSKGTQFMLAEKVVRKTCSRLHLKNNKNLVRVLKSLNHPQPSDAEFEGIWGTAGIGKTSIATEIFEILAPQYDVCYFLQDFHLMCERKGLRQMRDDFFSKVFGEEKLSIDASDIKPSLMRDLFQNKAVLVVLDDVRDARDAEYVVGGFGWFSRGHRIILTSRRKQVLVQCKVKEPYEIQKLEEYESIRLCKLYLREENAIISEIMSCSSGIPLALKALVSSVSKQQVNNMMEHLQSLRRKPPGKIQEAFHRSFDRLDDNEKNIFLDLACFFTGENKDHVVRILDACGFFTHLGICELIDESLISLVDNKIEIPIPFQDMGRFIVLEEDEDPCERSRLWDSNDIVDVLTNNSGTEAVEGIFLDASGLTCELSSTVFGNMYRLRLLKFYCSTSENHCEISLPHGLETLPDELRLLHWEHYPLKHLPLEFNPENLVEINMPYSNMEKLWEVNKNLEKLKKIKLSHSRNLTDIMMLSEALNLEHIDLEGCTSLVDISRSIPCCGKLASLNLKDCSHLKSLPAMVDLTSLKLLNLSGCFQLEEVRDFPPNLKELYLAGSPITEVPLSMENITLDLLR